MTRLAIPMPALRRALTRAAPPILAAVAVFAGLVAAAPESQAQSDPIVGRPRVIDGDTLEFAGTPVDIFGIDAPETGQACGVAGQVWRCGLEARWALLNRVGRHWVSCVPRDRPSGGNLRAVCYLAGVGQHDVGQWLVAQGWALAGREAGEPYAQQEAAAQAARKGLWRGAFEAPWDWRRGQPRQIQ